MITNQAQFRLKENNPSTTIDFNNNPQLILAFGSKDFFENPHLFDSITKKYPESSILACSTAGEIQSNNVSDNTLVLTAIEFEKGTISEQTTEVDSIGSSYESGLKLANNFSKQGLKHVILLSTAIVVNGDELLEGLREGLPDNVKITGGLAGDGDNFKHTYVLGANNQVSKTAVKAIGFYGDIEIKYSSTGGWEETKNKFRVTDSDKNTLYKINNRPALHVYKEYLGEERSKELPAIGLKHPFNMSVEGYDNPIVRTILGVDEEANSLIFAGDIVKGSQLKIMKASVDLIIEGARESAISCLDEKQKNIELTLIVSCVGRKLFLDDYVSEEIEKVIDEIGDESAYTGFYSYGEIAPFKQGGTSRLHNQTITLTTFSENSSQKKDKSKKGFFKKLFG